MEYATDTFRKNFPNATRLANRICPTSTFALKPHWGDYLLEKIRPMAVEDWFKNLDMAPKSKAHIRGLMHLMYQCAARWELFTEQRNSIGLVRVKNCPRRRVRPTILTEDSFHAILSTLKEPYKTMVVIAQCLGLRVSESAALQWADFDFEKRQCWSNGAS